MRVVVTGGGTYGHVSPIEPIIDELRAMDDSVRVLYIGMKGDRFSNLIKAGEQADAVAHIFSGKYRRYPDETPLQRLLDVTTHLLNLRDIVYIAFGLVHSYLLLKRFKPDVVFGKGGHVSVPVGLVASRLGVPLIIHESDSKLGIANRILLKHATSLCIGMPKVTGIADTYAGKTTYTGTPVRRTFRDALRVSPAKLKQTLGLDAKMPLVVISGGSQGAASINRTVFAALPKLTEVAQIVHVVGDDHVKEGERAAATLGQAGQKRYLCIGFTSQLADYFAAADVVVTRSSATSFAELAYLHKPVILIPAAHLSDQIQNAKNIGEVQAAAVIEEANMDELYSTLLKLLESASARNALAVRITRYAKPAAAHDIAQLLIKSAKKADAS